jgi:chitin disaccharide deacetylase
VMLRNDGRMEDVILVVNADDFGQSAAINRGVVRAHREGIVTSASLMVRGAAADEAAAATRGLPALAVGLHLDLGEWAVRDGAWVTRYQVVDLERPVDIEREMRRQVATFRHLMGRWPTHVDSHQHVHLRDEVRPSAMKIAGELGVPLRRCSAGVRYVGEFYGQTASGEKRPEWISEARLVALVGSLGPGVHELVCHPALATNPDIDLPASTYREERLKETEVLCAPAVMARISQLGIRLRSFASLSGLSSRIVPSVAGP